MIPTIRDFSEALALPHASFATLGDLAARCGSDGRPVVCRRTRFAEAEVTIRGERHLLCCPITAEALPAAKRTAHRMKYLHSDFLTSYRIVRNEMRYRDAAGREERSHVVLHALPEGRTLDAALRDGCDAERVVRELLRMEEEFQTLDFRHGNLKEENILVLPDGRLAAVRYHFAGEGPGDAAAFAALRRLAEEYARPPMFRDVPAPTYRASQPAFGRHKAVYAMSEALIRVEDERGEGFVDIDDRTVIEPCFQRVWDFKEGRAEVRTDTGMGLIDKRGRYLIEPHYAWVEFHPEWGASLVRKKDARYILFDYAGSRIEGEYERAEEAERAGSEYCKTNNLKYTQQWKKSNV